MWRCAIMLFRKERWPRGLWRRSRKAVPDCIGTWVQIPPSPPLGPAKTLVVQEYRRGAGAAEQARLEIA